MKGVRIKVDEVRHRVVGYLRRFSDSILSTIRLASATASAIAATYAGEFLGAVANLLAARMEAQIAITADFLASSTRARYQIRFFFARLLLGDHDAH